MSARPPCSQSEITFRHGRSILVRSADLVRRRNSGWKRPTAFSTKRGGRFLAGRSAAINGRSRCVHESVDEATVERVGGRTQLGEDSAKAGGHCLGLDVLHQRRFAPDEVGAIELPVPRSGDLPRHHAVSSSTQPYAAVGGGGSLVGPAAAHSKLADLGLEASVERVEEVLGAQVRRILADEDRQVLRHLAGLDRLDTHLLERLGELDDLGGAVHLAAVRQTPASTRRSTRSGWWTSCCPSGARGSGG